jgi:hypothetical protein
VFQNLKSKETNRIRVSVITEEQWLAYYKKLLVNNKKSTETETTVMNEFNQISMEELENALNSSGNKKASGIDNINMELRKYRSQKLKIRMLQLYNDTWNAGRTPEEWEMALVVNIFKNGDNSKHENYRGISLLPTACKLYREILKNKLQPIAENILGEDQCDFHKGRSMIDAIFTIKQIIEKSREFNRPLYMSFLDYEKAYNTVNRDKLWKTYTVTIY